MRAIWKSTRKTKARVREGVLLWYNGERKRREKHHFWINFVKFSNSARLGTLKIKTDIQVSVKLMTGGQAGKNFQVRRTQVALNSRQEQ